MEIRPSGDRTLGQELEGALAALDASVDKTVLDDLNIETAEQYVEHAERMKADKIEIKKVEATLEPFASLAYKIHRTITGAINKYSGYGEARVRVRDRALVAYDDRKAEEAAEDAARLVEIARAEDEARKKLEADAVRETNPERAEEIMSAPVREFSVSAPKQTPKVAGFGFRERYVGRCVDEEKLIEGVARPAIYREIAALVAQMKKGTPKQIADMLRAKAGEFPVIPAVIFVSTKGARDSLDSKITANANSTNGKIVWPGVVIEPEKKSKTRT
jgi:hypothetical protein